MTAFGQWAAGRAAELAGQPRKSGWEAWYRERGGRQARRNAAATRAEAARANQPPWMRKALDGAVDTELRDDHLIAEGGEVLDPDRDKIGTVRPERDGTWTSSGSKGTFDSAESAGDDVIESSYADRYERD